MKKLFLHIGTEKTGTSTLQDFLLQNHERLRATGFAFPCDRDSIYYARNEILTGHHPIVASFFASCPEFVSADKHRPSKEVLGALASYVASEPLNVILSAEHFSSRLRDLTELRHLKQAFSGRDVKVLVYLRPQHELLCSQYSTAVLGGRRTKLSVNEADVGNAYYNYAQTLESWAQVFGGASIMLKNYKKLYGDDIRSDFLKSIGIEEASDFEFSGSQRVSPSPKRVEFMRMLNEFLPQHGEVAQHQYFESLKIRLWLVEHLPSDHGQISHALSVEQKQLIIDRFAESNRELERKFLGSSRLSGWTLSPETEPSQVLNNCPSEYELAELAVRLATDLATLRDKHEAVLAEQERLMQSWSWQATSFLRSINAMRARFGQQLQQGSDARRH